MNTSRTYLAPGSRLQLRPAEGSGTMEYVITGQVGAGGSVLCYRASCGSKSGRLKEFWPLEEMPMFRRNQAGLPEAVSAQAAQLCRAFCRAYELLEQSKATDPGAELLNNFMPPYQLLRGGDTVYVWTPDDKQGVSFESYLQQVWKKPAQSPEHKLYNILSTVLTLTDCIRIMHRAELLHLDIKPDNFLVLYDGQFNINPANISLFDINTLCPMDGAWRILAGTEGYFAPEIPRGRADNRSDIYSIGAMLFRAVVDPATGKYRRELYPMLDQLVAASPLIRASRTNENVFVRHVLGGILKKCLAARPGDRYGSCEELMADLEQTVTLLLPDVTGGKLGLQKRLAILDAEPQDDCDPEAVIHDLLFRHPLDAHLQPHDRQLQVLVVGAGTYGQKFMDICLQAGQMLGRSLQITAISQRPELDREVYLQIRPALPDFVDCGSGCRDAYAKLEFLPLEFGKDTTEDSLRKLLAQLGRVHCAFISLGDDTRNCQAAQLLRRCGVDGDVHFVTRAQESAPSPWGNQVAIQAPITAKGIHPQLEQMAFHTHLSWLDTAAPDLRAAKKQFKKKYNLHASLAYALSVGSKLRSVGIYEKDPPKAADAFCRKILDMPRQQYGQLVALEHRRWVLEKVTAGWRPEQDLEGGIARGTMRDALHKTHPCILPSSEDMPLQHYTRAQWDTPGPWDEDLDPLDRLSVTQHRLCLQAAERLANSRPLQTGEPAMIHRRLEQAPAAVKTAFDEYALCLSRILRRSRQAAGELDRYEQVLQQTFAMLPAVRRKELNARLQQVRREFFPAMEACLYRDYKAQDERLICRIPYILDPGNPRYQAMGLTCAAPECLEQTSGEYLPAPRDTDNILLPPELLELTEQVAENVHDVWAAGRFREGWTYGESRDDLAKTNPCLVPYDQLPDSEKAYDRNTAMQTLKFITSLGYRIVPSDDPSA